MKVALVNYRFPLIWMSVELSTIIAALKQEGHDVHLIDLAFTPKKKADDVAIRELKDINPDVIGIHVGKEFKSFIKFLNKIRDDGLKQPIMISRIEPPHFFYDLRILHNQQLEDVWTFGEQGSSAIAEFLRDYEIGKLPASPHVDSVPVDPNNLPIPDFCAFDLNRYFKETIMTSNYLPIMASTGCAYDCSFCTVNAEPYLHKKPSRVLEEMRVQENRHRKDGLRSLGFHDPHFGIHKRYFKEMMALFSKDGIPERLPWLCETRADLVTKDWARKAAKGGCYLVYLGMENGLEDVRCGILKKKITDAQFRQALSNLREEGIMYGLTMMAGVPGTSMWTDMRSAMAANSFKPDGLFISPYFPIPGTSLGDQVLSPEAREGDAFPSISFSAHTRALMMKLISSPYQVKAGLKRHGMAYPREVLRNLFGLHAHMPFLPSRVLTNALSVHHLWQRPVFDLERDALVATSMTRGESTLENRSDQ